MSNLDKVMSKLISQKSVKKTDEVPEIEEPKKQEEKVEEVPEVEEPVEEEDNEDENGEEPVKEEPKADPTKLQEKRAEEIQILQNNGVFRVETLYQLTQINQNLNDLNTLLAGLIEKK